MQKNMLLCGKKGGIVRPKMPTFINPDYYPMDEPRLVGSEAFVLSDLLRWSDVQIQDAESGISIVLHGIGILGDGYFQSGAQVLDPIGATGRAPNFFDGNLQARFLSMSWLYVGDQFNCDILENQVVLGRLRLLKIGEVALTRQAIA